MSSTNKTTYYELPQFVDNDIFNPLVDDNDAYSKIDTALHNIANAEADDASEIVGIKSRLDSAEGAIDALEAQNGDSVLTTTAQTLSGAVNELDADVSALDGRLDIVEDDINNASTGLKVKVSALETQNGNSVLKTIAQTLSGGINEVYDMVKSGFVSPEMFGAIGDGTTDDSTAWQNAIDSGKAIVATGTYKIHNVSADGGNILIIGKGAKIYPVMNSNNLEDNCLLFENCDNVIVDGIEFTNPNATSIENRSVNRNSAIKFDTCKIAVLKDCYFHDMSLGVVNIQNNVLERDGIAFTFRDCEHSIITGCVMKGFFEDELSFISYNNKSMSDIDVVIEDCKIYNWQAGSVFNVFAGKIDVLRLFSDETCNSATSFANFICDYFNANGCELHGYSGNYKFDMSEALWYKCKSVNISDCIFDYNATEATDLRAIRLQSEMAVIENCTFINQTIFSLNETTPAEYQDNFEDYYGVLTTDDILIVKNCNFKLNYPTTYAFGCVSHLAGEIDKVIIEDCVFNLGNCLSMGSADIRESGLIFKNNTVRNANGSPVSEYYTYGVCSGMVNASDKCVIVSDNDFDASIQSAVAVLAGIYKSVTIHNKGAIPPTQQIANNIASYYADIEVPYFTGDLVRFNSVIYNGTDERVLRTATPVSMLHKGDIVADNTHAYLVTNDGAISTGQFTTNSDVTKYVTYDLSGVCYKALATGHASTVEAPANPTVGEVYTIGGIKFLCVSLQKAVTTTII